MWMSALSVTAAALMAASTPPGPSTVPALTVSPGIRWTRPLVWTRRIRMFHWGEKISMDNFSFDRIAQLLSQYLHANTKDNQPPAGGAAPGGKVNYKVSQRLSAEDGEMFQATIKGKDDREITFEWSTVPMVVRRAFKWLF